MILNQFKLETFVMSEYLVNITNSDNLFGGSFSINLQIIDQYGCISQEINYSEKNLNSCQVRNIQYFLNRMEHFKIGKIRQRIEQLKSIMLKIAKKHSNWDFTLKIFCIFRDNNITDLVEEEDKQFKSIYRKKVIRKFHLPEKQKIINTTFTTNSTAILSENHLLYFFQNKNENKQNPIKIFEQNIFQDQIFIVSQDQKFLFYGDYLAQIKPFKIIFEKQCQLVQFSKQSKQLALYSISNRFYIFDLVQKQIKYVVYIPSWVKFDFLYYHFLSMKLIKENYKKGERAIYKLLFNQQTKNQQLEEDYQQ